MRGMKISGVVVGAALLIGCTSTEWVHPRKPKDAFVQDYNRCEATSMQDPKVQEGSSQGSKFILQMAVERCLKKDGWLQVEKP